MITDLSLLHYLLTRSLTTGISLQPLVTALVAGVLKNFKSHPQWDADGGMWFAYTVVAVLTSFELLLAINVACRLEWQWWGAGWVTRWIPCGVIRRRPTHSERTSSRRDWEFGWLHRLAVSVRTPHQSRFSLQNSTSSAICRNPRIRLPSREFPHRPCRPTAIANRQIPAATDHQQRL